MRRLSLFVLLASAAVPALAAPGDDNTNGRHRGDSNQSEQSDSRSQRARETQQSTNGSEQRSLRTERLDRSQANPQSGQSELGQARTRYRQQVERQQAETQTQTENGQRTREWRQHNDTTTNTNTTTRSNWQDRQRQVRTVPDTNVARGPSRTEQQAFQNRRRTDYRNGNYTRWTNNWHNDRRYDWNSYRNHHRSAFRIGIYYDPFGWNYRPYQIGWRLWPSYYSSRYWIDDPWQYRLPYAPPGYRWVRYWDDAVLVDTWTGQVVDVIYNFFW